MDWMGSILSQYSQEMKKDKPGEGGGREPGEGGREPGEGGRGGGATYRMSVYTAFNPINRLDPTGKIF